MALRSAVTVAPDGSHCERKANGAGSSGGGTAPPLELLLRMMKNNHVGTIAQGPSSTAISGANDATASNCSARIPQLSPTGSSCRWSRGPDTSDNMREPESASPSTNAHHWRRESGLALPRAWKVV